MHAGETREISSLTRRGDPQCTAAGLLNRPSMTWSDMQEKPPPWSMTRRGGVASMTKRTEMQNNVSLQAECHADYQGIGKIKKAWTRRTQIWACALRRFGL